MSQFERTIALIGQEKFEKLQNKHILIVGCGGVGGPLHNLARFGIENFDIIDNDTVSLSNLNRQVVANHNTIGKLKTEVMKDLILSINPNAKVNLYNMFILPENINTIDFTKYDYVIDACDTVTAKLAIIEKCYQNNIKIISCMGTGNKLDPSKLAITDISKTSVCPLAKVIRQECKKRKINKLKVLYSTEYSPKIVTDNSNGRNAPASVATIPQIAGLMIVNEVFLDLIK